MTQFDANNLHTSAAPLATQEDRNFGMLIWGLSLIFPIIAPLIFMLTQKSPFVQESSKEALNFGISYFVYGTIAGALVAVLIGVFLIPLVGLAFIVFCILGLVAANRGEIYRVPGIFRLLK